MPHQTLSTRNDYEQKINYDWPYLVINFLCFRFPVENLQKFNQNQMISWDCNLCSTHSIYMK